MGIKLLIFSFVLVGSNLAWSGTCEKFERTLGGEGEFKTTVLEYAPEKDASQVILIIPPTGGTNFIDRSYARELCEAGMQAVIVSTWTEHDEFKLDLDIHTRFYQRAQKAIDMVVKEYADHELGILGTSVGGLHASIAAARRDEISRVFTIVSGGDIASIVAYSTQEAMIQAKEFRFKKHGYKTMKEYLEALKGVIPFEPLQMSNPKSENKKLGMIVSTEDEVVPTRFQLKLLEFWQPEFVLKLSFSHKVSVVWSWLFYSRDLVSFFGSPRS